MEFSGSGHTITQVFRAMEAAATAQSDFKSVAKAIGVLNAMTVAQIGQPLSCGAKHSSASVRRSHQLVIIDSQFSNYLNCGLRRGCILRLGGR
jgi:hypothetical protein